VSVVLEFLGERIRQAREAAIVHPHGEVRTLDIRGRDVRHIGLAFDLRLLDACAIGGAIAALEALRLSRCT
jgi:hypothetical protein